MRTRSEHPLLALLLLIAAWCLGNAGQVYWFSLIITIVLGLNLAWGLVLPGPPRSIWAFLLMVPFGFWIRQTSLIPASGMPHFTWLLIIGYYGIALGTYTFLASRSLHERLQALAAAFFAFSLSGSVPENMLFKPALLLFLPLLLIQIRREVGLPFTFRSPNLHTLRLLSLAVFMITASFLLHGFIIRAAGDFNRWFVSYIQRTFAPSTIGFSRSATVGLNQAPWAGRQNQAIMLRVWASQSLPYLRGAAYQNYQDSQWSILDNSTEVGSNTTAPSGRQLFTFTGTLAEQPIAHVYPHQSFKQFFFLPLGTHTIAAYGSRIAYSAAFTASAPASADTSSSGGYVVYEPFGALPAPSDTDLQVPDDIRPQLETLLNAITPPTDPPVVRAQKIISYFHENFTYELGRDNPPDQDPNLAFLARKSGHCEYFASSAALLLRTAKIPARYITGFVAAESVSQGIWIARNNDAHAWVEAYLPPAGNDKGASQWITLEPTPPVGRPTPSITTATERWLETLNSWWQRFYDILTFGGIAALVAILWEASVSLLTAVPLYLWALIGLLATLWVFRQNLRRIFRIRKREKVSPYVKNLRHKLRQAEKLASPHGVARNPAATITTFLTDVRHSNIPAATRAQIESLLAEYQSQRFRPHE